MTQKVEILQGDCLDVLSTLPDQSVHCCVTSPPYWGLRDYGCQGQLGLEETPEEYVSKMVQVFRQVRRVLRDDGTLWLNLGDSYASQKTGDTYSGFNDRYFGRNTDGGKQAKTVSDAKVGKLNFSGLKPKDLVGIPWRVAFALQADGSDVRSLTAIERAYSAIVHAYGDEPLPDKALIALDQLADEYRSAKGTSWYLRQDIIWHKPNPMPESVQDRCTKAHEYVFLLTKSERYYYDAEAVKEAGVGRERYFGSDRYSTGSGRNNAGPYNPEICEMRNRRSVWTITTKPYSGAHFAVMPPDLVKPCILAGCPIDGTVIDPFAGSGTVVAVALSLGRNSIGIELNPQYVELAQERIAKTISSQPLFYDVSDSVDHRNGQTMENLSNQGILFTESIK